MILFVFTYIPALNVFFFNFFFLQSTCRAFPGALIRRNFAHDCQNP